MSIDLHIDAGAAGAEGGGRERFSNYRPVGIDAFFISSDALGVSVCMREHKYHTEGEDNAHKQTTAFTRGSGAQGVARRNPTLDESRTRNNLECPTRALLFPAGSEQHKL